MKECQCEWKISNVKQGPNGLSDPVGSEEWQPPRRGVRRRIASPGEGEVLSEVYRMVVVVSGKTWIVAYSSVSRFWIFAADIAKSGNRDARLVMAYRSVPSSLRTSALLMGGQDELMAAISPIKVSAAVVQQGPRMGSKKAKSASVMCVMTVPQALAAREHLS